MLLSLEHLPGPAMSGAMDSSGRPAPDTTPLPGPGRRPDRRRTRPGRMTPGRKGTPLFDASPVGRGLDPRRIHIEPSGLGVLEERVVQAWVPVHQRPQAMAWAEMPLERSRPSLRSAPDVLFPSASRGGYARQPHRGVVGARADDPCAGGGLRSAAGQVRVPREGETRSRFRSMEVMPRRQARQRFDVASR
jgi:hypothetical protein